MPRSQSTAVRLPPGKAPTWRSARARTTLTFFARQKIRAPPIILSQLATPRVPATSGRWQSIARARDASGIQGHAKILQLPAIRS